MPYKHKRKLIKDSAELEVLQRETEKLAAEYLQGNITRTDYENKLKELNLYLDLRQLAVELEVA
jgi:hypothetical protein